MSMFDDYTNRYYPTTFGRDPYWDAVKRDKWDALKRDKEAALKPKTTYILISSSGAATHPTQHATKESAEKEAERLARKFPGEEITIYKTVKSYKAEEKPLTVKEYV